MRRTYPPRAARLSLLLPLSCAAIYALLAALVVSGGPLVRADRTVHNWVSAHFLASWWQLASGLTNLGSPVLAPAALLALAGWLSWRRHSWYPLRVAFATVALLVIAVLASKAGFDRLGPPVVVRPSAVHSWTVGDLLLGSAKRGAFPSGHTTTAVVTWTVGLWLLCGGRLSAWAWRVLTTVALVVGVSLVYADFHWLSDVLAGWAFGALLAWMALWLARWRRAPPGPASRPALAVRERRLDRVSAPER